MTKDAVASALDEHRRMGRSVPVMRDGKIIWLGPDELELSVETLRNEFAELQKKSEMIQGDKC